MAELAVDDESDGCRREGVAVTITRYTTVERQCPDGQAAAELLGLELCNGDSWLQ